MLDLSGSENSSGRQERWLIHTVGHGRQPLDVFVGLLEAFRINLVCDVRSVARSRWPQYNGASLSRSLASLRVGYEHLPECGGKIVVPADELRRGVERILELAGEARVALMCSESQPLTRHVVPQANCHRVGLLSPPLKRRGARVIHILPDGESLQLDEKSIPTVWNGSAV